MAPRRIAASALIVAVAMVALVAVDQPLAAEQPAAPIEPASGKERALAVFGLGCGDYAVPPETLAPADAAILEVFVNLGRFNVTALPERLSAGDLKAFIAAVRQAKREERPLQAGAKFGEVQLTEELIAKLYGASVVVIPTVTDFQSGYNDARAQFEATVKTTVAFLDVTSGSILDTVKLATSGSSMETERKAVQDALAEVSSQLAQEIGDIGAFNISAQVIRIARGRVELRLDAKSGLKAGDEYAVIVDERAKSGSREKEKGLILIEQVGDETSTGTILYGEAALAEGGRLREVPRFGLDIAPYGRYLRYFQETNGVDGAWVAGLKLIPTRGFYIWKPLIGLQMSADESLWYPIAAYFGAQYDRYFGRFTVGANAAVGGSSNLAYAVIHDRVGDTSFLSLCGMLANVGVGFLVLRDLRLFAEVGTEYWLSLSGDDSGPSARYGGFALTFGAAIKL